jgi:uncharacterized protein
VHRDDPHRIASEDELRALVGEPNPLTPLKIRPTLEESARGFIARAPFLLLSTADPHGEQQVSPRGDEPGFVAVLDEATLAIPERKGNRLVMGLRNLLENPAIGLLFLIPGTPETLRVNGSATLTRDPELCARLTARGRPALLAIRVEVRQCFFHCAKAFLRSRLWQPESWSPRLRISFGELLAGQVGGGKDVVAAIDRAIDEDYRNNL